MLEPKERRDGDDEEVMLAVYLFCQGIVQFLGQFCALYPLRGIALLRHYPHISFMEHENKKTQSSDPQTSTEEKPKSPSKTPVEHGGPKGPEPTRYGDWEKGGRCTDF